MLIALGYALSANPTYIHDRFRIAIVLADVQGAEQ